MIATLYLCVACGLVGHLIATVQEEIGPVTAIDWLAMVLIILGWPIVAVLAVIGWLLQRA